MAVADVELEGLTSATDNDEESRLIASQSRTKWRVALLALGAFGLLALAGFAGSGIQQHTITFQKLSVESEGFAEKFDFPFGGDKKDLTDEQKDKAKAKAKEMASKAQQKIKDRFQTMRPGDLRCGEIFCAPMTTCFEEKICCSRTSMACGAPEALTCCENQTAIDELRKKATEVNKTIHDRMNKV